MTFAGLLAWIKARPRLKWTESKWGEIQDQHNRCPLAAWTGSRGSYDIRARKLGMRNQTINAVISAADTRTAPGRVQLERATGIRR